MTTDTSYATVDQIRLFNQDEDMSEALIIALVVPVSRAIDKYCRRHFYTVTATRLYDWSNDPAIRLRHDLVSLTGITCNDGAVIDITKLTLEPRIGPPYSRIAWKEGVNARFTWTGSPTEALSITGVWGYQAELPADIGLACQAWVSDIYATSDSRGLDSVSGGGIRAAMKKIDEGPPPDVKGWLDRYVRPSLVKGLGS